MAWCRYLCPLGIALWPFSALGRLRLVRKEHACTHCGACDQVCPQAIDISNAGQVRSGECTLCFECMEACPEDTALELQIRGVKR
jgi:polyferredoxin